MKDSWCRPGTAEDGKPLAGAAMREKRIKRQGGMDRVLAEREMRGYRSGYRDAREDTQNEIKVLKVRVSRLEKDRAH